MNTSINYSGFIDLLGNFASENNSGADQNEQGKQEPALEPTVEQVTGNHPALSEETCSD